MADKIILNQKEEELFNTLCALVIESQKYYEEIPRNHDEQRQRNKKMAKTAHDLHMALKEHGLEPKHHKYMYENRGVPAEDVEFYNHFTRIRKYQRI